MVQLNCVLLLIIWLLSLGGLAVSISILVDSWNRIWSALKEDGHSEDTIVNRDRVRLLWRGLAVLFFIILFGWLTVGLFPLLVGFIGIKPNELGDTFGFANTLFSGFAFAGVVIAIVLQSIELKNQRQEMKDQRMELAKQNAQLATTVYLNAISTLISVRVQDKHSDISISDLTSEVKYVKSVLGRQFSILRNAGDVAIQRTAIAHLKNIEAGSNAILRDVENLRNPPKLTPNSFTGHLSPFNALLSMKQATRAMANRARYIIESCEASAIPSIQIILGRTNLMISKLDSCLPEGHKAANLNETAVFIDATEFHDLVIPTEILAEIESEARYIKNSCLGAQDEINNSFSMIPIEFD